MSVEIEAKVKVGSHEAIAEELGGSGAVLLADIEQADIYYDFAQKSLTGSGKGMRIRRQKSAGIETVILTYKGKRQEGEYKIRPEHEVEVSDGQTLMDILDGIGLQKQLTVEKKRQMWQFNDCEVCLDDVAGLGAFVEVEGPSEATVKQTMKMLGLDGLKHIQDGYAKLLHKKAAGQSGDE